MRRMATLLATLGLFACSASINPQMRSVTDVQLAAVRDAARTESAPQTYAPSRWTVGQWVLERQINQNGEPSIVRISVVAQEPAGYWIESDVQDYYHRTVGKVLYARQPRNPQESADLTLRTMLKIDDGEMQVWDFTTSDPAMRMAKSILDNSLQGLFFSEQIDPAGTFDGCANVSQTARRGVFTGAWVGWFHPAVPVNGFVKGRFEIAGTSRTLELLDYGSSGAKSVLVTWTP